MVKVVSILYLSGIIHGFKIVQPEHFKSSAQRFLAALPFDEDGSSSMVAAASAATLCIISGDDPVLKSWCDEAMQFEIPQLMEGENELSPTSDGEWEDDDEELILKVTYTEEMVKQLETDELDNGGDMEEDELCVIGKAFDIDKSSSMPKKRILHPKKRKHLFRYSPDISVACWLATVEPKELLRSCGYTVDEIERMSKEYPKLLDLDAKNLIAPKLRFLVKVLGGGSGDIGNGIVSETQQGSAEEDFAPHNLQISDFARQHLPTCAFFNPRLETTIAPRHAYLAFHGDTLPFGEELMQLQGSDDILISLLSKFLQACTRSPAEFASLCQKWETLNIAKRHINNSPKTHSAETVKAMDNVFAAGIAPFARNQKTPYLEKLGKSCTPADMVGLLLDHGANYAEHDDWGSTILHWAAGTGNIKALEILISKLEQDEEAFGGDARDVLWSTCASCSITRDGATPLHWASCGVTKTHFGCGGHVDVVAFLLDKAGERRQCLANAVTSSGNTPLMWACWSGSMEVAKLLVSAGADPHTRNDNGVDAAHWAASGGNINMCKYLHDELGLGFSGADAQDNEGKTPLDVALSFGHLGVTGWITKLKEDTQATN